MKPELVKISKAIPVANMQLGYDLHVYDDKYRSTYIIMQDLKQDPNGNLWLVTNHGKPKISSYTPNLEERKLAYNDFDLLGNPWSIEFFRGGILIGDAEPEQLKRFSSEGKYEEVINGYYGNPQKIENIDDTLYIYNDDGTSGKETLDILRINGSVIQERRYIPQLVNMTSRDGILYALLYIPSKGEYTSQYDSHEIIRFEKGNEITIKIPEPSLDDITVDPYNNFWFTRTRNGRSRFLVYSSKGEKIDEFNSTLNLRTGAIRFDKEGRLVVVGNDPHSTSKHSSLVRYEVKYSG